MDEPLPQAVLVHAIRGRARLRFEVQTGDGAFFEALAQALVKHPAVRELRVSAATGSLVLLHDGEVGAILEDAQARKLFVVVEVVLPRHAGMRQMRATIEALDDRIATETDDTLSVGKLAFVALVGAGVWQASTGFVLPASLTMFDYAFRVMNWVADREPTMLQRRSKDVSGS